MCALTLVTALIGYGMACRTVVEDYGSETVFGRTTSGAYDEVDPYWWNLFWCNGRLEPEKVTEVDTPAASSFFNTLSGQFTEAAGWTYRTRVEKLSAGTIRLRTYDVLGSPTRVGAEIHVRYEPTVSDPSTDMHWIQVVSTNHSLKPPAGHGNSATYVDIPTGATTPYYDDGYAANNGDCSAGCDLYDLPSRTDPGADHTWEATTFLVQGPDVGDPPGMITLLWPGFRWGWVNHCEPLIPLPDWWFYLQHGIRFQTSDRIEPGSTIRLRAEDARLGVMKGEAEAPVTLLEGTLTLSIDEIGDHRGFYGFQVTQGLLRLGEFEVPGEEIGRELRVRSGSGYIHWESGEASIQFLAVTEGAEIVFTGTAELEREAGAFTLLIDTKGVERQPELP
jgi:hypothetical protein